MTDTNQAAALAALLDGVVGCRTGGTPAVRHQTGEPLCGPGRRAGNQIRNALGEHAGQTVGGYERQPG